MKKFFTRPLRPLTRAEAWGALGANLLLCPGLGSLYAGRRAGWVQALLSITGGILFCAAIVLFFAKWARLGRPPGLGGRIGLAGFAGLAVFFLGWLWALATGLSVLREARQREQDSVPPRG
jgi:hypothetical protein